METMFSLLGPQDPLLTAILIHMKPVDVLPYFFFKINLNIIPIYF